MKPTQVPFARQTYRRDAASTPEQILRNLIVEKDDSGSDTSPTMLLQRPGLTRLLNVAGPIQAVYAPNNATAGFPALIVIAANTVYTVANNIATSVGSITGTDVRVSIVSNFDRVAIVANNCLWLFGASAGSLTNTFRQVAIPDGYLAVDVTMIDGYFIIAMTDGTYYWLVPGDDDFSGDINPLHFATAESMPDGLVGVDVLNGNLFFLGSNSIECWQTTGNADQPFERTPQQGFQRGCLARDTIRQCDNSLVWVGEDAKVYRASAVPTKISTTGIDERLKERTGPPSAWSFSYNAHLYYVLNIPGQGSFAYDVATSIWSEFASEGSPTWRAHCGTSTADTVICGDSASGAVWQISDSATDDGLLIRRTATACVVVIGRPARNDDFAIDVGSSGSCEVGLRWCDADELLTDQQFVTLDATAGANVLSYRRLGQALAPFRQFEVEITDPVTIRLSSARLGDVWR